MGTMPDLTRDDDLATLKRLAGVLHEASGRSSGWRRRRKLSGLLGTVITLVYQVESSGKVTAEDVAGNAASR